MEAEEDYIPQVDHLDMQSTAPHNPSTQTFTSPNTPPNSTNHNTNHPSTPPHALLLTNRNMYGAIDSPENPFTSAERRRLPMSSLGDREALLPLSKRSPPDSSSSSATSGINPIIANLFNRSSATGVFNHNKAWTFDKASGDDRLNFMASSGTETRMDGVEFEVESGKMGGNGVGVENGAGEMTDEQVGVGESRYLLIQGLDKSLDPEEIKRKVLLITPFKALVFAHLKEHGSIILILYDPRAGSLVHTAIREERLDLSTNARLDQDNNRSRDRHEGQQGQVFLQGLEERVVTSSLDGQHIKRIMSENEAGLCITMDANGRMLSGAEVKGILERYGELRNFRAVGSGQGAFLAEYYDSRDTQGVIQELHNRRYADICLFLSPMTIDWKSRSNIIKDSALLYAHYLRFTQDATVASLLMTGLSHLPAPVQAGTKTMIEDFGRSEEMRDPHQSDRRDPIDMHTTPPSASSIASSGKYMSPQARLQAQMAALGQGMSPAAVVDNTRHLSWRRQTVQPQPETPERAVYKSSLSPSSGSESGGVFSGSSASSTSPYSLHEIRRQRKFWEDRESDLLATPPRLDASVVSIANDSTGSLGGRSRYPSNFSTPLVALDRQGALVGSTEDRDGFRTTRSFSGNAGDSPRKNIDAQYKEHVPPENRLSLEHLMSGRDTRTTVMIKDVPNKLTRQQLINAIEEVVPGEIDFVYLRFDFANKCNVAYAFVNFTSTDALARFAEARLGQKWNVYMSEKICQMSYANIQGRDSLINHFRNSTVMDVTEEWRPLLLSRGRPIPFPEPIHSRSLHRSFSSRLSSPRAPSTKVPFTINSYDMPLRY